MSEKRKIEIFSAGCSVCDDVVALVNSIACSSCEVSVLDMRRTDVAARAKKYGIQSVPAIVINGKLADCCSGRGVDAAVLKSAGLGTPL